MDDARALAERLRERAANHLGEFYTAAVDRVLDLAAADLLDRLAAPEGVGLTLQGYADDPMWADHAEVPKSVLRDAVAAIAAKEYELKRFHEARANAPDYEALWAEQTERAEAVEAERDALKAALRQIINLCPQPSNVDAIERVAVAALSKTQGGG